MAVQDLLLQQFQQGRGAVSREIKDDCFQLMIDLAKEVGLLWSSFGHYGGRDESAPYQRRDDVAGFNFLMSRFGDDEYIGEATLHISKRQHQQPPTMTIAKLHDGTRGQPVRIPVYYMINEKKLVGRALNVDGKVAEEGDQLMRDYSKPGHPVIYRDPGEELLEKIVEVILNEA